MIKVEGHRLVLTGPLNMSTAARHVEEGRRAVAEGAVEIDLSAATEIDSAAVALLLDWIRTAGKPLKITGMPKAMASLASLYGVDGLLPRST
ncbi:MAG: lipid asymmetry maintenance protein MlaB [Burkholderiales bacterium]